ncbi:MAG: hypothetical protein ACYSWO_19860 [Planctomycetota bacterium]|jgi:aconitate hydratase
MATTRKRKTTRTIRRNAPKRKTAARKPVRNVKKKTTVKKGADLTWGKTVKGHPISGRPVAGRKMSQRDQKLFTKMGKRRAGVTLKKIKDAYGNDYEKLAKVKKKVKPAARKAAPKRKTTTRKTAPRRKTAARKTAPKRKTAIRKGAMVTVSGLPARPQTYVVIDGRARYQSSHRLLSTATKKQAALSAANPRKTFKIVKLNKA